MPLPPLPGRLPPPRSFRTDTIGIFAVLFAAGLAQLINQTPGPVRSVAEENLVADIWEITLASFGLLGLLATLTPKRWAVIGLGMEFVARIALGLGALAYSLAVGVYRGFSEAEFSVLTYLGISVLMIVGAAQIMKWLREQRKAVDGVLAITRPQEHPR